MLKLPQSVSDLESLIGQIKTTRNQKVTHLKKTLEDISHEINKHSEKLGNISVKVADIKDRLNKIDEKRFNFKEIQSLENELTAVLQTQERELRKIQESITDQKTTNALVAIGNFKKAIQLSEVIFDTYSKYKSKQTQLDAINEAIKQKYNELQKLKQYEDKIYDVITPTLQNMQGDLRDVADKLDNKSSVALDVTKWQVQSTIRDMKLQMQQMTQGFKVKDNLARCIEKLEETMTVLINVYDHIQNYQKDQNLGNYIANINSITADDIDIIVNPKLGEDLRNAIRDLEITVRSSIVLQRHQVAIYAFKQFVFPFVHDYLKGLVLPSHLKLGGANQNNTTLENLVYAATTQIEEIKSKLEQYKRSLTKHDGPIGTGEFNSHYDSTQPFFVWKNEQHKNVISKLLSGQEIIVKADIMNSSPDEDAIKFNTIELNFKSKNETSQFEVNNILKGFNISMTHLGNSYYRYNDKIYPMTTNSQDIWYYFEKNNNSEPVRRSLAYDKLKNGDFMLSPYALWKIKLINVKNKNNFSFKDLETYKDKIDLELGGNGYYVNKGGVNEDLMVERYYKAIDTYNHLDLNINNEELSSAPLLQDSNSTRNKREVHQESENQTLQTIVNQEYPVTQNNHSNIKHENNNTESSGWFSWMRLPSFNILPGAEAAIIEGKNLVNQKEDIMFTLDSITIPFMNGMKLLKDVVLSKISKPTDNITNSNASGKISNNYTDYIIREDTSNSSNNLAISFDGSKNNNIQAATTFDINGNLTLGQLVIHKVFGGNKSFGSIHYVSPEQEHNIRINKLASEILPVVNHNPLADHSINVFVSNYNSAPQWYQNMYKDELEEIVSKRHQRNERKDMYENSSEKVFEDSVWMFGEVMNYGNNDIN
ncbi:hypothetical protein N7281_04555 [Rickettsia hoogstraalii]|uniref:hypothetical protein n=1 Tax=Rickettsia hoogstraalii TaxID=467174 RepID=UPI0022533175|nr:hypothetical protein [Rickettsia hoogstraalii]MCX4084119.1 hypothetical protein [Rickettsia hoogstraalii]